jgi:allantoinase
VTSAQARRRYITTAARVAESMRGYAPFEGVELSGRVKATFLRCALIYDGANVVGPARRAYLRR